MSTQTSDAVDNFINWEKLKTSHEQSYRYISGIIAGHLVRQEYHEAAKWMRDYLHHYNQAAIAGNKNH